MKMKLRIKRNLLATGAAVLLLSSCCVGCGQKEEPILKEITAEQIPNHLAQWEEELPRDTEFSQIDRKAIRGLTIQKGNDTAFAISYEPREYKESYDYWDISIPYKSLVSVNTEEMYELFGTAGMLLGTEVSGVDLETAGLNDEAASIFIAYDATQRNDEKGQAQPTGSRMILVGNEDGQDHYYVSLQGSDKIFVMDKRFLDELLNIDPYQYILKIPVLVHINSVSEVNISMDDKVHSISRQEDEWLMDGRKVEQDKAQKCYSRLMGMILAKELPEGFEPEEGREPVLVIQYIRNIEEAPDIELRYYEYDEEYFSVSVNGEEHFLVEKESVYDLKGNIEENF